MCVCVRVSLSHSLCVRTLCNSTVINFYPFQIVRCAALYRIKSFADRSNPSRFINFRFNFNAHETHYTANTFPISIIQIRVGSVHAVLPSTLHPDTKPHWAIGTKEERELKERERDRERNRKRENEGKNERVSATVTYLNTERNCVDGILSKLHTKF